MLPLTPAGISIPYALHSSRDTQFLLEPPPPNCILLSKYWMGLRTQSWAAGFPPPPPQNARVSSIDFGSALPPKRGSTWGLFLRLLDTLPPCFHLLMDLMEALSFAGTMGSQESGCLSCVGEGVFPHLVSASQLAGLQKNPMEAPAP